MPPCNAHVHGLLRRFCSLPAVAEACSSSTPCLRRFEHAIACCVLQVLQVLSFQSAPSQAFTLEADDLRIAQLLVGAVALLDHMITYMRTSRLSEVKAAELRPLAKHTEHGLSAAKILSSAPERDMTTTL